jgi:hypothetical protein
MKFGGIVVRIQFGTPKVTLIRAGADIVDAETAGTPAPTVPSRKLRTQILRKMINAIENNESYIEIDVHNGRLTEDS